MHNKKPDLRAKDKVAPTDNHAVRAGTEELSDNVRLPQSDMHPVTPEIGKHLAEGQVTKSN
jgi:hypothetical protein